MQIANSNLIEWNYPNMKDLQIESKSIKALKQSDDHSCGFIALASLKICLQRLQKLSVNEYKNLTFDELYKILSQELSSGLKIEKVSEAKQLYRSHGEEKLAIWNLPLTVLSS